MEFSEEMVEVGRFQWKKIGHLFHLIREARRILKAHPGCVLFYPPASAKWVPFLRDIVFLTAVRQLAGATVFIFHASGLPVFARRGPLRRLLARLAYWRPDVSREVAQEMASPHEVFRAISWQWCPCAIEVPQRVRVPCKEDAPCTVLFVGSLQEGKGVIEVLRTAKILKLRGHSQKFRFRLVGKWFSSDFEEAIRHFHEEWEFEDMVELTGQLTGDAKWDAYFEADVFFFPTHYESEATPIVLMEALGAGLPIISTEWAGIPAMLEGCASARILPIRSPEAYAEALIELAANRSHAAETARISKRFYQENFLPARFIERVGNAFHTAAAAAAAKHATCSGGVSPSLESNADDQPATVTDRRHSTPSNILISVYLADQNPGYDRSYGISRMSQVILDVLHRIKGVNLESISSKTSQQAPETFKGRRGLPWGTRFKLARLVTDHLHPLFTRDGESPDVYYFPKGYLPLCVHLCRPAVVTIHDTIIQYDEDHYPAWRPRWEYAYWSMLLRHTLRHADHILTVSEASKAQIERFMERHGLPAKEIVVTYEPCQYESIPQPEPNEKEGYVIHLASREPHKRTTHLVRWWHEAEQSGRKLPMLHLVGTVPEEVEPLLASSKSIVKRPFLDEKALQAAYLHARALILPSEIEGFGLPALEAYYLSTPVCYVKDTSVEEVLSVATTKGGFSLDDPESLFSALEEVMSMPAEEVQACGLKLRETYAADKVAERMMAVFEKVKN
jgi:glycosyltransferase involved in cell wall biosynthesis